MAVVRILQAVAAVVLICVGVGLWLGLPAALIVGGVALLADRLT